MKGEDYEKFYKLFKGRRWNGYCGGCSDHRGFDHVGRTF